ncbi:uncharacterized protein LOC125563014 [Nematostella vectensis]|uniref:uncharacterized protein LOC125563014 n=1 Tax=Nematostella vectensis TaxID=45351 RepID=UPI00207790B0|nr:uncharacterized protein LOC125563014 [Nematostella vectensis]
MAELAKKKKVRGAHRGAATRLIQKAHALLDGEESDAEDDLRQICGSAKEKIATLRALDDEILELLVEAEDDEDLEKFLDEGDEMRGKLHKIVFKIEELLSQKTMNTSARGSVTSVASSEHKNNPKVRARLPKLEVRKFGGKIQEWPEFWDSFESAIHNNECLSDADKFAYLKGLLLDEAKPTIAGFAMTAANYHAAVELLRKRYGKPKVIQRSHITDHLNLSPVFTDGDLVRLRRFLDTTETHYRGLQALKVNESIYSGIVVPALIQKLPNTFRLTITRGHPDFMAWGMEELLEQIKAEVELREEHKVSAGTNKKPQEGTAVKSSASSLVVSNGQGTCVYCQGKHSSEKCEEIKLPGERKKLLIRYAICFRCLRKNHRSFDCRSKDNKCKGCGGAHHVSICERNEAKQTSGPGESQQERGENEQLDEITSNHVTSGGTDNLHVGSGTRVALQTAQGIVKGEGGGTSRTRFLFDTGSHRSFITQSVTRKATLPVVRREWVCINAFGQRNQKGALREVVEAFVVPEISNIPNSHVELVRDQFPHLEGLWFSDGNRGEERLEIEVLVGADYLWQFQRGCVIRGKVEEPVAIETELGWVLSGPMTADSNHEEIVQTT